MEDVWDPHWTSRDEIHNVEVKDTLDGINLRWDSAVESTGELEEHGNQNDSKHTENSLSPKNYN